MADTDRITLVILKEDGSREKRALQSFVGIPRRNELLWIAEEPYLVVEVEYAIVQGFFGGLSIEAAGVYARRLTSDEQSAVARRLTGGGREREDERPFRP